jgi:HSP20 family protein
MDAYRTNDQLVIAFDVPGVDTDAIEVTVVNNTLKVVAPRPRGNDEGIQWLKTERPHGTSTFQLDLGDGVDLDTLQAHNHNGVLTITIPVIEPATRRVQITHGEQPVARVETAAAAAA